MHPNRAGKFEVPQYNELCFYDTDYVMVLYIILISYKPLLEFTRIIWHSLYKSFVFYYISLSFIDKNASKCDFFTTAIKFREKISLSIVTELKIH